MCLNDTITTIKRLVAVPFFSDLLVINYLNHMLIKQNKTTFGPVFGSHELIIVHFMHDWKFYFNKMLSAVFVEYK